MCIIIYTTYYIVYTNNYVNMYLDHGEGVTWGRIGYGGAAGV